MAASRHGVPALLVGVGQTQLVKVLEQHLWVENSHHQFFAECRGQGRKPQFHFDTRRVPGLDAAILGFAFFGHVHSPQAFQAADHGHGDLRGKLIDVMQQPINAKAHPTLVAAGLDMDIAGSLAKGVLQQPVDDVDDMRVVGIRLLVAGAEAEQVEIARRRHLFIRTADGLG